jgi:PAS domain S-box-containing protein
MEVTGGWSLRASNARLRCLADAIGHLQAARSQDRVMDILRRTAHRLCDADGICVVRRGGDQCHYAEEEDASPFPRGQHSELLSRVAELAMRQRRTAVVADAHADPRIPKDDLDPAFVRSLVAVPVGAEAPEAAIGVYWSRIHMPDREEVSALEALARSAAGAFRAIDLLASLTRAKERAEELHEQARRDLAERERAEEALRASEASFRAIADLVPDLLWHNDTLADVDWYNRRWQDYTGLPLEAARGLGWLKAVHPEDRPASLARFRHAVETGTPVEHEHRIRGADGRYRWFLARAEPVRDAHGAITAWYGAATDIDGQRTAIEALGRSEAALRAARDEAERARAAAEEADRAKSRFLAAASHDLRQPVMAAGLYVDQLARRLKDRDARMLADMVRASLDGLRGLLNGLLETARLEAGAVWPEVTAFALDDLLQRLSVEFEAQALASRLWLQVPHTLAVVRTDCLLLELMLRNLIGNALKYTRRGGVTVEAVEEGGSVRIEVRDTGIGIPADQLGRIFEDFYQVDDAGQGGGFGLGLATVRRAAAVLGYEVEVRSEPGRGSTFSIRVPLVPQPEARPGPAREAAGTVGLAGYTVLVAEDDPLIAEALGLEFREWGLDVVRVAGLAETRACVAGREAPVDLVVSDYQLGDGNGMEAIRAVRSRWRVPAILLTGDTGIEVLQRTRDEEVRLLHKPVLGPDLARAVAQALHNGP